MASKWINTTAMRALLLVAGTATLTWGIAQKEYVLVGIGVVLLIYSIINYFQGVKILKEKCYLMLEAIRNNDYSFRLPTTYHSASEQVLQDTINQFGSLMSKQKQQMVQHEKFYEQIMSSVSTGIIVIDEQERVVQANPASARLLGLPILSNLRQLERYGNDVADLFRNIQVRERKQLHLQTDKGEVDLSITCVRTELNKQSVRILIMNDIHNELDEKELDSWIKLTRVLTHEIMNSMAPISSVSDTFMQREDVKNSELYDGIRAIHETSSGLISFVDSYRKFSALQQPQPEPFYIQEMMKQVSSLNLVPDNINLSIQVEPEDLMLYADPNLIRQIMINLLKNAVQAIGDNNGRILVHAYADKAEHVFIDVSNNGPAISDDLARQIFVPFFTTKQEGSGIGLSLARQIMKLSGGTITLLKSGTNNWPVIFQLEFA
jgi:nitrogen fixation/metabolism regulation signal transduction histidine kinase